MSRLKPEENYKIRGDAIRDRLLDAERKRNRIMCHMGACGICSDAERVIAAKAIGSRQGYIYWRAEYPLVVKILTHAIEQTRGCGLLGNTISESRFDFDIEVYRGAGAFVCGEETALMTSIEGKRGTPRPRPSFPAIQGLWNRPTALNNVETFAKIPQIISNGGKRYASAGTTRSKGTKAFLPNRNGYTRLKENVETALRNVCTSKGFGIAVRCIHPIERTS